MSNPIRNAARTVRESIRSRLWPVPTLGVLAALALGILLPSLDAQIDSGLPPWLDGVVFGGDAGAARTVLDAVSSSLITVTSLTFSLTVVTLQLASSQFSPRLLRTFTKDLFVQVTLAIFLATFTFSLTVLRSVRSSGESVTPFVPRISVTVSFLLAVASVIALVLFLAHLTRQIRVETMLVNVHDDATGTIVSLLDLLEDAPRPADPLQPGNALRIRAERSGFLLRVDEARLVSAAKAGGAVIWIDRQPGSFVVNGTPLATVWSDDLSSLTGTKRSALERSIGRAVHLGAERTGTQDVGYGLRQMVDVANKALSPGINDPTTAVHALGHISALLCELSRYRLGSVVATDEEGNIRAGFARPTFEDYLDEALTQVRHYGSADPLVVRRLLGILRDLAFTVPRTHNDAVIEQLARLRRSITDQGFDENEKLQQEQAASDVLRILADRS